MSTATTASRRSSARRISSKSARSARVHGMPYTRLPSVASSLSSSQRTPGRGRRDWPGPEISGTAFSVIPSACRPSKKLACLSRSAAHPVTAPAEGSSTDCSRMRCSGTAASTSEGTCIPLDVRRYLGPEACPGVGPWLPLGSIGRGRTSRFGGSQIGLQRWRSRGMLPRLAQRRRQMRLSTGKLPDHLVLPVTGRSDPTDSEPSKCVHQRGVVLRGHIEADSVRTAGSGAAQAFVRTDRPQRNQVRGPGGRRVRRGYVAGAWS